ncbi:hypothetical protein U1Q18_035385 [Sarracenia purpurea var. burkii]
MGKICNTIHGLRPAIMMVVVQAAMAGVNVFYKIAANIGMSLRVLIAYRFLFAAGILVPLALVVERKSRPKLTWVVAGQAFLCGLLGGSMAQNLYAQSLALTSATFAAAMTNLIPAITLVLAISFGLERLAAGTTAGKAKVAGTLLCIGGAMLLTFYKGPEINPWKTNIDILHRDHHQHPGGGHVAASQQRAGNHVLGALLAVCCCFCTAMGLIVQAKMIRNYPCPYSSTALMITMGAIQAVGFGLCMDRNWSDWELGWDIRLLTVSYSGIVGSGVMFTFMAWCVQMRGPLFVSVFSPLMLVLVAIAGSLLLNEKLHLGTVLGAVVIVCGLYAVLWGKGKELKRICQLVPSKSSRESERIDVIVTSTTENSIHRQSSSNNALGFVLTSMVSDDLNADVSQNNNGEEKKEDDDDSGDEGKNGSIELNPNV